MKNKGNVIIASILGLAVFTLAGFALDASASSTNSNLFRRGQDENNQNDSSWTKNLTAEQQAVLATIQETREQERVVQRTAMTNAINSGNYNTWAAAVREQMGDNAPVLEHVNAGNFAQYVEAHNLMLQAREKFEAIGLDDEGMGMRGMNMNGARHGRNHAGANASASLVK